MAAAVQTAFDFLSALSAAEEPAGAPVVITTHAAWVFLAGATAYKIKRPVSLGFLDFSTLEARRRACTREFELNQRFAPDLYRGVLALVTANDGAVTLCPPSAIGDQRVVEWVVEMTRFDNAHLLSRRIARKNVPDDMLRQLAKAVDGMHRAAPVSNDIALVDRLGTVIDDVTSALQRAAFLPPRTADTFMQQATGAFRTVRARLHDRLARGFVRRCHGDLHCENIVVIDGRPTPFDALEFDERLGTVDVLYDLGFLLMDLSVRGGSEPAATVLNAYLDASGEAVHLRDLDCLRFFMALRAGVRAMVTVHKLAGGKAEETDPTDRAAAARYAAFAASLLQPVPAALYVIGGGSGTGKSTVARALAPRVAAPPGAVHLRSDILRKQLAGVSPDTRLPPDAYTQEASDRVYRALLARAELALAAGQTVILDAVFGKRTEREAVQAVAGRTGARLTGIWLTLDEDTQRARVAGRTGDVSDATPGILAAQRATLEPPGDWRHIDARADPVTIAESIA